MAALEKARKFFTAGDGAQDWEACRALAEQRASFAADRRAALRWRQHTGDGGPVPPIRRETHYAYAAAMSRNDKAASMVKIWDSPGAMAEFGWA